MCRYGFHHYKTHYVCFDCRKSFKHDKNKAGEHHPCPQCSKPLANMGMDFRAPKTSKKKEWEIVRGMYKIGHRFQTCGCLGPGLIPKDSESYYNYLNQIHIEYKKRLIDRSTVQSLEELSEYIAYWEERLNRIENEIGLLPVKEITI